MTVLFMGTEREALQDSGTGDGNFVEGNSGGYYDAAQSRGYSTLSGGGGASYYDFPIAASTEVWCHFNRRYYGFDDATSMPQLYFMDASDNVIARLAYLGGDDLRLQYWNGSSFVSVGTGVAPRSVYHTYDVHVKKHATAGVVEFYYDGSLWSQATNIDTSSFGDITHVRLVYNGGGNAISEILITDNEPTIGYGVTTFWPLADGADTGGTGTYADVDELQTSTADFIALDTAGQAHCFTKGTHSYLFKISGVAIAAKMRVADGTGPQHVKPYVRIGGTRYYGTTFALTNGFTDYEYVWQTDPATGLDWDFEDVGSDTYMQFGWEAVA